MPAPGCGILPLGTPIVYLRKIKHALDAAAQAGGRDILGGPHRLFSTPSTSAVVMSATGLSKIVAHPSVRVSRHCARCRALRHWPSINSKSRPTQSPNVFAAPSPSQQGGPDPRRRWSDAP